MPGPWASFGGFKFKADEKPIYGTDAGWGRSPKYARQSILGSSTDVMTALSIGSAERSFEMLLTPRRFDQLEMLLNSRALFTDWRRPEPDARMSFLAELIPTESVFSSNSCQENAWQKRRVRITIVSST